MADPLGQAGFWLEQTAPVRPGLFVPLYLPFLADPVPRQVLERDPVLRYAGVLSRPFAANPSWLSTAEWAALQDLLGPLATDDPRPAAGPEVETVAVAVVRAELEDDGWQVRSVETDNLGWDLEATRARQRRLVEVKGRGPDSLTVLLTANEVKAAHDQAGWELAVLVRRTGRRAGVPPRDVPRRPQRRLRATTPRRPLKARARPSQLHS